MNVKVDMDRGKLLSVLALFALIFLLPVALYHTHEAVAPTQVQSIQTKNLANNSNVPAQGRVAGVSAEASTDLSPAVILLVVGGMITVGGGLFYLHSTRSKIIHLN